MLQNRFNLICVGLALLVCAVVSTAQADTLTLAAKGKGETITQQLGAADSAVDELVFYYVSKGNITAPLDVLLYAPPGTTADVQARVLSGSTGLTLRSSKNWVSVPLSKKIKLSAPKSLALKSLATEQALSVTVPLAVTTQLAVAAPSSLVLKTAATCDTNSTLYKLLLAQLLAAGQHPTQQQMCDLLNGGSYPDGGGGGSTCDPASDPSCGANPNPNPTPTPTPSPSDGDSGGSGYYSSGEYFQTAAIVHKDTCSGSNSKTRYIVRLRVHLTKIDKSLYSSGFEVGATLTERLYKGKKSALLKPNSDGKFAGRPIVMMMSAGGYSRESIYIYRWKKSKPSLYGTIKTNPINNVGAYVREPVGKYLKGGKATFELKGPYTTYSVCFKLERKRQSLNGAPKR